MPRASIIRKGGSFLVILLLPLAEHDRDHGNGRVTEEPSVMQSSTVRTAVANTLNGLLISWEVPMSPHPTGALLPPEAPGLILW